MITDMERIGDQAADIAEILISGQIKEMSAHGYLVDMASQTSEMVKKSIQAFVEKDLDMTRKVIVADNDVDQLFDQIKEALITFLAKEQSKGGEALDMLMIAKYLERIGDHATNIAEWVEFSITGVHRKLNYAKEQSKGGEALDMLMIAKYLERIGDHATNIAEWVEFSITGVHRKLN